MKSLLLFIVSILISFSSLAQADEIDFGIEIGLSKPKIISNIDIFDYTDASFRPSISLYLMKNLNKNWSFEVGIGYLDYRFENENNYVLVNPDGTFINLSGVKNFLLLTLPLKIKRHFNNNGLYYSVGLTNKILFDAYMYLQNTENNKKNQRETIGAQYSTYALAIDGEFGYEYSISSKMRLFTSFKCSTDLIDLDPIASKKDDYYVLVIPSVQIGCVF
ncbi:outer membrane beta-barrel protein [Marivirga tractuosa]|uniref:outer membrane beta-barrel protein n=1 Tax=Marivirga tractuosa TaxID=1006 RepID=UPI0035CF9FAC